MSPRLVLFDFDYTLVDASGSLFPAIKAGLRAVSVAEPPDEVLKPLIGISLRRQFANLSGTDNEVLYSRFQRSYVLERDRKEVEGTRLMPEVPTVLAELKKSDLLLGIVSSGASVRIRRVLSRTGILAYFSGDRIFGGASDKSVGISEALQHFQMKPRDAVYVGDRPDDGTAAKRAGISFIGVATGAFRTGDFPSEDTVLESINELPRALAAKPGLRYSP